MKCGRASRSLPLHGASARDPAGPRSRVCGSHAASAPGPYALRLHRDPRDGPRRRVVFLLRPAVERCLDKLLQTGGRVPKSQSEPGAGGPRAACGPSAHAGHPDSKADCPGRRPTGSAEQPAPYRSRGLQGMPDDAALSRDFSQYGEQPLILAYLATHPEAPPYCVDAGAYDGVIGSNSRALFLRDWSGIVIEPDPRSFARLRSLYEDRSDITCLRRALSARSGVRRMQFCKGPPGTNPEDEWKYAQVNTFSVPFAHSYVVDYNYEYRAAFVLVTTLTRALRRVAAPRTSVS